MVGLEIALVVIGILIFVGSFFITEKLSSSDKQEIAKISENEIKKVVKKQLDKSEILVKERLDDKLEAAVNEFAIKTDDEFVSKMNNMSEHSEKIIETMNKSNDEMIFVHGMLNDKHEAVKDLTDKLDKTKSELLQLKSDVDASVRELKTQYDQNIELKKAQEFTTGIEAASVEKPTVKTFEEELVEKISVNAAESEDVPEGFLEAVEINKIISGEALGNDAISTSQAGAALGDAASQNGGASSQSLENGVTSDETIENIINLYKEGFSEVEIAKNLGKGIGEIKLVLSLYNK